MFLEHPEHRRHRDIVCDTGAFNEIEGLIRVEAGAQNRRPAGVDQRSHENVWPSNVEERELECGFVSAVDAPGRDGVDTVPGDVSVSEDSAFWEPCRATRIVDAPRVVQGQLRDIIELCTHRIAFCDVALSRTWVRHGYDVFDRGE